MAYTRPLYLKSPQMYGEDVKKVQRKLNSLGFNCGAANGYFGPNTKDAVKRFQKSKGLSADGSCGPATFKKLFASEREEDITKELKSLFKYYENKYRAKWSGITTPQKLYVFYNLVRNGAEADLKNHGYPTNQKYIFNGRLVSGDAPGNILYGYVGKAFGFSDILLLRAAGFAQCHSGTSKPKWGHWSGSAPYGDDPNDQENIKVGMNYYRKVH